MKFWFLFVCLFDLFFLQLYLIWFGDQSNDENETSIGGSLGEVALRSGGEILQVTEESLGNGETGLVNNILFSNLNGFYFFIFFHTYSVN